MASNRKLVTTTFPLTFVLVLFSVAVALPGRAQTTPPADEAYLHTTYGQDSNAAPPVATTDEPAPGSSDAAVPPPPDPPSANAEWHFAVSPYLWFPGVHGTASGPNGRGLGFRASPGDLLSHFRFGLMGAAEASHKRLVFTGDILWIRLADDKAIAAPRLGATSASIKATEFFLSPKIGVRLADHEKIKVTALAGMRYWHLGQKLTFNPSRLGLSFNGSHDFVDPLVGGRIDVSLSPKIVANVLGDVGGWGTGSELEYQWAGVLGYRLNPKWTLQAGYRYLNIDKHGNRGVAYNATTAGVVFGVTINLK